MSNNHIVIIGGMGPQASLELHKRILDEAANKGAKHAHEFPQISHLSVPFPDFISNPEGTKAALRLLSGTVRRVYLWQKSTGSHGLQYRSLVTSSS